MCIILTLNKDPTLPVTYCTDLDSTKKKDLKPIGLLASIDYDFNLNSLTSKNVFVVIKYFIILSKTVLY